VANKIKPRKKPQLIILNSPRGGKYHTRHTRSSPGGSTGISVNYATRTRDPRESINLAGIKILRLIRDELKQKSLEKEAARHEQKGKRSRRSQSPQTRRSSSPRRRNYKAQREDARNIITQARVNRS
jgi:hypothetical protein